MLRPAIRLALLLLLLPTVVTAQHDYRNLDRHRPIATEDAYPVEHGALELMFPFAHERAGGEGEWMLEPEMMWGFADRMMAGLGAPIALGEGGGLAALRPFAFATLAREGPRRPALALRLDGTLPVGSLGGEGPTASLTAIATRSFGASRAHVNVAATAARAADAPLDDAPARWRASLGFDHTLWRRSMVVMADVRYEEALDGAGAWLAGAGVRMQFSPTMVLDAGVARRLSAGGPDLVLTAGLTWAPGHGGSDWSFRARHEDAARLFNAFDYGHAVLYERLLTLPREAATAALRDDFAFLTADLLLRPPRFGVAEEAVSPEYIRLVWEAKEMFDASHELHRQIYDVYARPERPLAERRAEVERMIDRYLATAHHPFAPQPKSMALMDDQPFSQRFRREQPVFNGLIWAYHWLQVGLYEPLLTGASRAEQEAGVAEVVEQFRFVLADPARYPTTMPMTADVSPRFAAAHPRAAAIFDNLHMLHDIISDILADPAKSRAEKAAEIRRQVEEMEDATRNLMGAGHVH